MGSRIGKAKEVSRWFFGETFTGLILQVILLYGGLIYGVHRAGKEFRLIEDVHVSAFISCVFYILIWWWYFTLWQKSTWYREAPKYCSYCKREKPAGTTGDTCWAYYGKSCGGKFI